MKKAFMIILLSSLISVFACGGGKTPAKPEEAFEPEKAFMKANELLNTKYYEEARTAFFEITSRDTTKKYAPLAQLRIADSYLKEKEPERAIDEYRRFLEIYPEHQYAPYAQYQIAMVFFDQIESPERGYGAAVRALEEFERLKRMFPRNPYKEILDVRISRCNDIIAGYEFIVGTFYFKKESYTAAINRLEGLLKKYPNFKKEADALYYLTLSYKRKGEREKAEDYFNQLMEKYPNINLVTEAKKELFPIKTPAKK